MAKTVIKRKEKKNITSGVAHINSTFNNTRVTITDAQGNTVSWSTAGAQGFKGSRKSTPYAAQIAAEEAGKKAQENGMKTLEVEVNVMEGTGKLELTGNLGDVMKESAHAALSYIRANSVRLGIAPDFYKTKDIHVHFPEGAVPKDGPSAGITVCTAIVSALTGQSVRRDVAMTGEISLRGRVMAIGGLKEKTMAALRHGIRTVIIPQDNEKDLDEIDQTVRNALTFIPACTMETVLTAALNPKNTVSPSLLGNIPSEIPVKKKPAELRQ